MKISDLPQKINSREYWDQRFSQDWQQAQGPAQSEFFSRLALSHLPAWLINLMRLQKWSLADWGCAEGEGVWLWSQLLRTTQLTGIDFSDEAIHQARQKYPALRFSSEDWLSAALPQQPAYDVVYSSNTLEHFHQPQQVLETLSHYASKLMVLVLPYREQNPGREHFSRFYPQHIPYQLEQPFQLIWSKVVDCRQLEEQHWQGEQIILIYAHQSWLQQQSFTLAELSLHDRDLTLAEQLRVQLDQSQAQAGRWQDQCHHLQLRADQQGQQLQSMAQQLGKVQADLQTSYAEVAQLRACPIQAPADQNEINQLRAHQDQLQLSLTQARQQLRSTRDESVEQLQEMQRVVAELHEQLQQNQQQLLQLKQSYSWTLTRPLRFTQQMLKTPGKASYQLAKHVFWKLPTKWRWALHKPRHQFVRWVRGNLQTSAVTGEAGNTHLKNLSWAEFSAQVLSRREQFKGIFVQELVIDWNVPLYQRPQHIANAFARLGYLVIYRTDNWSGDNVDGCQEVMPNVWLSNCEEVNQLQNVVRSLYSTAHFFTPESILKHGRRGALIYEYIDHIDPQISGDEANIRRLLALKEFAFNGGADFIVASARKLADEAIAAVGADKVIIAQNGVDTRHYRNIRHVTTRLPENLLAFRQRYKQVVGYFGALAPWLWYDAIKELVASRPDTGFVFIGPDYFGGSAQLPSAENLLYLGTVDYKILPAYARQFDICLIPFAPGEIARTTSPLKLFEYFALEKPVVVTSEMAECVIYPEVFRGHDVASLNQAIDQAWTIKDDLEFKQRLADLADQNDWDRRALAMAEVFQVLNKDEK